MFDRASERAAPSDATGPEWVLPSDWETADADDGWLVSFADMLSVVLAMVVLLLGRLVMVHAAASGPPARSPAAPHTPVAAATGREAESAALDSLRIVMPAVERLAAPLPALSRIDAVGAFVASPSEASDAAAEDAPPAAPGDANARGAEPAESQTRRLARLVEERFRGDVKTAEQDSGLLLTIADVVLFDSASAELQASAKPMLTRLAGTLKEVGEAQVSVEGHTDDRPVQGGEFASNWDLAAARANAVTRFLLSQGFDPRRLHSVSYADTRPVAANDTASGRAANRRVELQIQFPENGPPEPLAQTAGGRAPAAGPAWMPR
jgi:chemotaxis protein MotB